MPNVRIKENETSLDVAVLNSGHVDGVFDLALTNGLSITQDLVSGDELMTGPVIDEEAKTELGSRRARPASAIDINEGEQLEGIGYWIIGNDFIVQ
ncbi:MAG: hypothetical protein ACT4OJ_01300 [Bacteroidota bacterium]